MVFGEIYIFNYINMCDCCVCINIMRVGLGGIEPPYLYIVLGYIGVNTEQAVSEPV
jgi:hypothetical protein